MTVHERTQVGIVGAGPAGLLLSHLLALGGVDSVCVETRSRAYCEARQRAGMLESTTVELLRAVGLGRRLDAEGLEHDGIYLQFAGERHHVNFRELTGGRWVTIYAQTEIVKDLIQARTADRAALEFEAADVSVADLDAARPLLRYTDAAGGRHEATCDAIAGCDGFRGITRWPDDRIWAELRHRMATPGWELTAGPVLEKAITPMRSFVAAPMRYK